MTVRQALVPWLLAIISLPEVLGRDNSSWPATRREHLLIQHTPKTGGTSFRSIVLEFVGADELFELGALVRDRVRGLEG